MRVLTVHAMVLQHVSGVRVHDRREKNRQRKVENTKGRSAGGMIEKKHGQSGCKPGGVGKRSECFEPKRRYQPKIKSERRPY